MNINMSNGQVITSLTTTNESNSLIMRKGRTTLLSAKVMLFALLKVENRNQSSFSLKENQYYDKLLKTTGVDYRKGLVAEMDVSDLKKLLKKENSGSFYASLRELFSTDPHDEKSLRNSWAVMMPRNSDDENPVYGYAEVITSCSYDTGSGKLFIKFSDEEFVKSQIWQIRSEYTELPFLHMINIKSIYTYRLYEIIYSEIVKADQAMRDSGEFVLPDQYSFRLSLGSLLLSLGILDISKDSSGKRALSSKNPDYNEIASDVNSRQHENMGEYRSFRRYSLDVATKEINQTETSAFTISYDVEKDPKTRKVAYIIFYVKKKKQQSIEPETNNSQSQVDADFIVDLARELSGLSLNFDELTQIAVVGNYDKGFITAAYVLYKKLGLNSNFVDWFIELKK